MISTLCSGLYLWKDSFRFRLFPTRLRLTELAESECGVLLTSVTIVNKDSIDSRLFLKSSGITYSITILEFKPPRQLGSYFPLRPLCPPREARSFRRNHRYPFYRFLAISVVSIGNKVRPSQSWSMSRQLVELIDQEACAPPTELTNQTGQECENSNQQ